MKKRKEARQFAEDLKSTSNSILQTKFIYLFFLEREAENILAENEKKRLLLNELKLQAEKERAVSL